MTVSARRHRVGGPARSIRRSARAGSLGALVALTALAAAVSVALPVHAVAPAATPATPATPAVALPTDGTVPGAPTPTAVAAEVTLQVPSRSRSDLRRTVSASVRDADDGPVEGLEVVVEVDAEGGWSEAARGTSAADGTVSVEVVVPRSPTDQRWRARLVPDPAPTPDDPTDVVSEERSLTLVPWAAQVRRTGPRRVVDGSRITHSWRVTTPRGAPVAGATLVVRGRVAGRPDTEVRTTDDDGRVTLRDRPRRDSRWVARVRAGTWHAAGTSRVALVDNVPAGPVVRLPEAAPRPRLRVPKQPRALRAGPRPVVTGIPRRVWREMRGVTWRRGCPVGRRDLRLVRVSYWAYDGYARRGEIVVNAAAAETVAATFADVYRERLPLRSMYRVDRFGYSPRLRGGDDFASMDAGNTSGFNCRRVVNYSALSPHSYGFAIDINTWENPYRSRTGVVPNTYWQDHSHPLVAWRSTSHRMVRTLLDRGWAWPYGLGDTHHFSAPARGPHARAARGAERDEHRLEHAAGHADHTGYVPGGRVALD